MLCLYINENLKSFTFQLCASGVLYFLVLKKHISVLKKHKIQVDYSYILVYINAVYKYSIQTIM